MPLDKSDIQKSTTRAFKSIFYRHLPLKRRINRSFSFVSKHDSKLFTTWKSIRRFKLKGQGGARYCCCGCPACCCCDSTLARSSRCCSSCRHAERGCYPFHLLPFIIISRLSPLLYAYREKDSRGVICSIYSFSVHFLSSSRFSYNLIFFFNRFLLRELSSIFLLPI